MYFFGKKKRKKRRYRVFRFCSLVFGSVVYMAMDPMTIASSVMKKNANVVLNPFCLPLSYAIVCTFFVSGIMFLSTTRLAATTIIGNIKLNPN